jgi:hypothetical protein
VPEILADGRVLFIERNFFQPNPVLGADVSSEYGGVCGDWVIDCRSWYLNFVACLMPEGIVATAVGADRMRSFLRTYLQSRYDSSVSDAVVIILFSRTEEDPLSVTLNDWSSSFVAVLGVCVTPATWHNDTVFDSFSECYSAIGIPAGESVGGTISAAT